MKTPPNPSWAGRRVSVIAATASRLLGGSGVSLRTSTCRFARERDALAVGAWAQAGFTTAVATRLRTRSSCRRAPGSYVRKLFMGFPASPGSRTRAGRRHYRLRACEAHGGPILPGQSGFSFLVVTRTVEHRLEDSTTDPHFHGCRRSVPRDVIDTTQGR